MAYYIKIATTRVGKPAVSTSKEALDVDCLLYKGDEDFFSRTCQDIILTLTKVQEDASKAGFMYVWVVTDLENQYYDEYSTCAVQIFGTRLETPEEIEARCTKTQKKRDRDKDRKKQRADRKKAQLADTDYQKFLELKKRFNK